MDAILLGLRELAGVSAALVCDGGGRLVAFTGHSIYDERLCDQVAALLVKAIDSIQLQQDDWDSVAAQFADGKILLRNLGVAKGQSHFLAVFADETLNPSFATVALRVAVQKLKKALEAPTPPPAAAPRVSAPPPVASAPPPAGASLPPPAAADPAAAAFLVACAKELAQHVGPMSKVYVKEALRRVSPQGPFSLAAAKALVDDLAGQIEDPRDRIRFRKALDQG